METRKWIDMTQPQTLVGAQFLLYLNAAFALISLVTGGNIRYLIPVLGAGAAYGIANQMRIGWYTGIAVAVAWLLLGLLAFSTFGIIGVLFDILLVVLLLHPMTRNHQRIWFK